MVVLMTAATMAFMSCSKENKIEGKWKIVYASTEFSDDKGETWTFKENKSWSGAIDGLIVDGDWSISKDELTIDVSGQDAGYTYRLTGEFSIDELTGRELSLSGKWTIKWSDGQKNTWSGNYEFEKK